MLDIRKTKDINKLTVFVNGRMDALTAPKLDSEVTPALNDIEELVIDLKELNYISSAGIRVLLQLQKAMMMKKGSLTLVGMSEDIYKIFKDTGMTNVFAIRQK